MSNRKFTPISFTSVADLKLQAPIIVSKTQDGNPAVTEVGDDRVRVNLVQIGRRYFKKGGLFLSKEAYNAYRQDYTEGKDLSKLGFLRREEKDGDVQYFFVFFEEAEVSLEGKVCTSLVISAEQAAENLAGFQSRQARLAALQDGPKPPVAQ